MSSRLRGMKVVASTIIPRVQRLLETGVLEKRPLWLDVAEACPPLPPPILPKSSRSAKSFVIEYPVEEGRRSLEESGVSPGATTQSKPISLFERRSVKRIQQWPREREQDVQLPLVYTAERLNAPESASGVTEPFSEEEMSISTEAMVTELDGENMSPAATLNDHQVQSHFEDTIKGLAALLKDHENQNLRK